MPKKSQLGLSLISARERNKKERVIEWISGSRRSCNVLRGLWWSCGPIFVARGGRRKENWRREVEGLSLISWFRPSERRRGERWMVVVVGFKEGGKL